MLKYLIIIWVMGILFGAQLAFHATPDPQNTTANTAPKPVLVCPPAESAPKTPVEGTHANGDQPIDKDIRHD